MPAFRTLFAICADVILVSLQNVLRGEGEVARAFADDTAVVVSDYSKSLGTIASLFPEFESISGLELNIKKTVFVPLWPIADANGLRNLIRELCPNWKDIHIDTKLLKEWQQFDSIISNTESLQRFSTPEVTTTQKTTTNTVPTEGTSIPPMTQKDIEMIPENPSNEIVLHVEEIPPLDVFYSPKHRAVIKRQRKKRKLNQSSLLTSQVEITNVVWREEVNPSEAFTKLS